MKVVEVKHPLVKHKLGLMREADISTKRFRELAKEVGSLLMGWSPLPKMASVVPKWRMKIPTDPERRP